MQERGVDTSDNKAPSGEVNSRQTMTSTSEKNCNDFHKHVKYYKLCDLAASSSSQVNKHVCRRLFGSVFYMSWEYTETTLFAFCLLKKYMQICEQGGKKGKKERKNKN